MPSIAARVGSLACGDAVWPRQISCLLAVMKATGSGRCCKYHHEVGLEINLESILCLQQAQSIK